MTLRRRLADRMSAEYIPDEPKQLDAFDKGIADALVRRGIVTEVPGRESAAEIEWAEYRARTRQVLDALTPRPPAPDPEPEEPMQTLPEQIRQLIGQQHGAESLPLNGQQLIDHATARLHDPGGRSAQAGQSASGRDTT
jgi:hypothetical protein